MGNVCMQINHENQSPKLKAHSKKAQDISKNTSGRNQNRYKKLTKFEPICDYYDLTYPEIGSGGSGKVYKIVSKSSKQIFVAKRVKREYFNSIVQIERQIKTLKDLNHQNIVSIYEIYINDPWIYIVMEYCSGGELLQKIKTQKQISETIAARYMIQILEGIFYCHSKDIIHGDLKPENIIFKDTQSSSPLKIIDFGSSSIYKKKRRNQQKQILSGTVIKSPIQIYYVSPEFFDKQFTMKGDTWACGVILYIMLCGQAPFNGKTDEEISQKIINGQYSMNQKVWSKISKQAKSLVKQLLNNNPNQRLSARDALNHSWILKYKENSLKNCNLNETISNMMNFCKGTMFQNTVLKFLTNNVLAKQQKQSLILKFKQLDTNGDGKISLQEFKQSMKDYQKEDVLEIFNQIDTDNSGYIVYEQFIVSAIQKKKYLTVRKLSEIFDSIDTDKNGVLSRQQIQNVIGKNLSQKAYKKLMEQQSTNQKGEMTKARFIQSMKRLAKN